MRVFRTILLLLLLSVSLSLGAQDKGKPFVFTPQGPASAQFAGYYVALEQGFYAEEGLNVEIVHPFITQSFLDLFRQGRCQATIMPLTLALRTTGDGLPLVNILQTSMNSATVLISRWGKDPLTLHGAKVTASRTISSTVAQTFSEMQGLDFQWIPTAAAVNLFVSGAVDATLARSFDEYYQILQTRIIQPGVGVYRFADHDYNIQQDGIYVTRKYYKAHREQAEAFARASRRGWEWAAEHPAETLGLVMRYVKTYKIETNRTLQQLMLDEVLRLQVDRESGEREFRLRPNMVERANDILLRTETIPRAITLEELLP